MHGSPRFTACERDIIARCSTPRDTQAFICENIRYRTNPRGCVRTFRRVLRERYAQCLEGSLFAACVLGEHGYPPHILCLETSETDHCLYVYQNGTTGYWGAIEKPISSRTAGKPAIYSNLASLAHGFRKLICGELRGFTHIDLTNVPCSWRTGRNAKEIDELLYDVAYVSLGPEREGEFYISDCDGTRTWLHPRAVISLRRRFQGILLLKNLHEYDRDEAQRVTAS
ncbi:hypothetical protein HYR82_01190 [Candidatus Peregrinibacteria bacterium]|nr:hypothetical protein [Candidatus Peregrinibacteria bacterium]